MYISVWQHFSVCTQSWDCTVPLHNFETGAHILDSEHCITQPQDCTNSQFVWNIWPERAEDIQKKFLILGKSMLSCRNRQSCTHHSSIKCSNYRLSHIIFRFSIEHFECRNTVWQALAWWLVCRSKVNCASAHMKLRWIMKQEPCGTVPLNMGN